jgi:hypothetical protein
MTEVIAEVNVEVSPAKSSAQDMVIQKSKNQIQDALWFLAEQYRSGSSTDIELARAYLQDCERRYMAATDNKKKVEKPESLFFKLMRLLGFNPRPQFYM